MEHCALILAAGSGYRIVKTINTPKCLIKINDKTILEHQLNSFELAGIKQIYIVVGFQASKVKKFLKKYNKKFLIKIIHNRDFKKTNNMYSAHLASKFLINKKFILCNADVVIEKHIVKKLISGKNHNEILVDKNFFDEESMKIKFNSLKRIVDISKKITKNNSFTSIDFYKFSEQASKNLFYEIDRHINKISKNDWTEISLKKILSTSDFYFNDIKKLKWCEIDTYKDLIFAENKFDDLNKKIFKKYKNFVVDIDGTTFKKQVPIDGTYNFLQKIKKNKKKITFLSNNSSLDLNSFINLFKKVNFKVTKTNIIISTDVLIRYLNDNKINRVFASGNKKFINTLKRNKITITKNNPDIIIVSYDDEINYKKLKLLSELLNEGIKFVATHNDNFYPSQNGPIPDTGSILSLLETTTGRKPIKIFGKPSVEIKKLLKLKGKTLVIGDKVTKDIQFAKNCGYDSALIMTEQNFVNIKKIPIKLKPDYLLSSIKDLS